MPQWRCQCDAQPESENESDSDVAKGTASDGAFESDVPWVIENAPGKELENDLAERAGLVNEAYEVHMG